MRYFVLTTLLFLPSLVYAACSSQGATVVYVNGILTTSTDARADLESLHNNYYARTGDRAVSFYNGYNPSHLAGLGDLAESVIQSFGTSITNFDRDTILLQIHPEVTTRKLLLVGHSQGSFYTNSMYDYLLSHGEPKESVGVYNVATPANYTAGGGSYLTSSFDVIIGAYADGAKKIGALPPLPPNIDLPLEAYSNGHGFGEVYLARAGDRVVGDIQRGLMNLKAGEGTAIDGCFTPPDQGIGYKTQQAFFAVADPTAVAIAKGGTLAYQGAVIAKNATVAAAGAVGNALGSLAGALGFGPQTQAAPQSSGLNATDKAGFTLLKAIAGSSLDLKDLEELNSAQGGAVVEATNQPAPKKAGIVEGVSTQKAPAAPAPLIPFPSAPGVVSPGYGGGGGSGASAPAPVSAPAQNSVIVTYAFEVADAHAVAAACSFDDDPPAPCSGSFSKELEAGEHTFTLTATDIVGNVNSETRHFTVLP